MAATPANLALDGGDARFKNNTGEGVVNYSEREIKHLHDPKVTLEEYGLNPSKNRHQAKKMTTDTSSMQL